ncbi:unnamed protein product [Linum tenue]|uniref:Disease resistance protein RGA3 n=2 Tax=Linum tenue TaxID=586396 RepID=A0AAV0KF08_9ROSI|nr:unnamed protein product [Linum tenue]
MAAALAELVMKKLASLAADQVALLGGLKSEISRLQSTMSTIQAVLLDAEEQSGQSHQIQDWISQLNEVFYDAEDLLDDLSTEAQWRNQMDDNHIVNEDKNTIIDMVLLSSYAENVVVVPITGFGGLGKTTLAQFIYNDERITFGFDLKIWVCVSINFDEKLLVKKMLESVTKGEVQDSTLDVLKCNLHEKLNNKKFLLVLDDVWDHVGYRNTWDRLKGFLRSTGSAGSRVIVTTRFMNVAESMATSGLKPYELHGLPAEKSWHLFEQIAFAGPVRQSPTYIEVGEEIVNKCRGVPLVIRTMAGLLSCKTDVDDWVAIRNKQVLINIDDQERRMLATLRLSYDHLPSHLKRCFVYCSLFPKDYEINVKTLIQLWIGQGYINSNKSSCLEDVGIEYVKNLLWRSFFQEYRRDRWGNIKWCKMHDLAVTIAGKEIITLNASNVMDSLSCGDVNLERVRHISLDFENEIWEVPTILGKAKKLRTFFLMNVPFTGFELEDRGCEMVFSNMIRLRVLSLNRAGMEIVPSSIRRLKHLRYLDLSGNKMQTIPEEITRLINLQVLSLHWCKNLRQLPRDTEKLCNLAYLGLDDCESLTSMPVGIGKLTCLRELSLFVVTEAVGLDELKRLNKLSGELYIRRLERVKDKSEAQAAKLEEKSELRKLTLSWSSSAEREEKNAARSSDHERSILEALQPHTNLKKIKFLHYGGTCLLTSWFTSLRNLVGISVIQCDKLRVLPSLDTFVSLEKLALSVLDRLEYIQSGMKVPSSSPSLASNNKNSNDSQFLPSIRSLAIYDCCNLIGWSPTNTKSPFLARVTDLVIRSCPKMILVPCFAVQFEDVRLMYVSSELLSAFSASLISPPQTRTRFRSLALVAVKGLRVVPQDLLPQLASLESLRILYCHDLIALTPAILQHLPSLQELSIYDCGALELEDCNGNDENDMALPVLPNLRILYVFRVPKLVKLPRWLQHCSNLQKLQISSCHNLMCLPSWLTKLTALESLEVYGCDILSGRCSSGSTAEDWPKVSHIPNINIDHVQIQEDGCYKGVENGGGWERLLLQYMLEEEARLLQQREIDTSSRTQFSRMLANCVGRLSCNLFQRCFLS